MNEAASRRNKYTAYAAVGVVAGMVGLAYAAVPLYERFCRVTGYGGTTQQADVAPDRVIDRVMTVQFSANTARGMPWEFKPVQREVVLRAGETGIAFYKATNNSDVEVTGTATFNVTPLKIGQYFTKIDCFCFTEQTLAPGQTVDMPVTFFVDPLIDEDPNAKEVQTITLSYTFFRTEKAEDEEIKVSAR